MHQCHRNLLRAVVRERLRAADVRGHARAYCDVTLGSEARFVRYGIEVGALDGARGVTLDVPANGQAQASVPLPESKRGVLRIDRLHISTSYPYNLFRAWTWVAPAHRSARLSAAARLAAPMPTESGHKSGTRAMALAGADEWLGLRPFRDGDSPRQVAWKAYARGCAAAGEGIQRARRGAAAVRLRPAAVTSTPKPASSSSRAGSSMPTAAASATASCLPDRFIAPDSGPQHRHECLEALARYALPRERDAR